MNLSTAIALITTATTTISGVFGGYYDYEIPAYPDVAENTMAWPAKPEFVPLNACKGIHVGLDTKFDYTIEVDHCLLDCNGYALRGQGLDPVVYVRNGGQLVNCPINVEQDSTGVVCDKGDCFLLDVSCHGEKNFDECVLIKNRARNVVMLLLEAIDPNGANGVRALQACDANIWLEGSNIQNQRKDGVSVTKIKNLIMNHNEISYNGLSGVDARNVANYVVALASYFNDNGDKGFDAKRTKNFLFAFNEANRNQKKRVTGDDKSNKNGLYIEGPNKVEIVDVYAQYNHGDGFNMNNVHYLMVRNSYAAYNKADGFDLRRITNAKIYKVDAYQNYLAGLRSFANGELYVEDSSVFYENGLDTSVASKDRSGLFVAKTKKAFISETSSYKNGGYGYFVYDVSELYIEYTKAYENYDDGFDIETSAEVEILNDTTSVNNQGNGFTLTDIARLYISEHIQASYNENRGFDIQDVGHVEIRATDSFKNKADGFYLSAVQYISAEGSVSAHNGKDGIFIENGKVPTEVVYDDVVACENGDDGMVFQGGFDDESFWFTPKYDVFSCDNHDLDLQFDGIVDVSFVSSDSAASEKASYTASDGVHANEYRGINDITADTCADKNGDEHVQPCKDLNIAPCAYFVCPSFK
ncbi:hypothetical protein IV203_004998 [Nitzschia inconspicua]|uniref:Right handed beta helix domain-containing protein n=1 Tax=Nitzschia inconspicua TaxID=303405 RepID=A0A9K3KM55_9STRA|nr:hypothetical protein IV203_004998 [Nitzschia inconspicua]